MKKTKVKLVPKWLGTLMSLFSSKKVLFSVLSNLCVQFEIWWLTTSIKKKKKIKKKCVFNNLVELIMQSLLSIALFQTIQ